MQQRKMNRPSSKIAAG